MAPGWLIPKVRGEKASSLGAGFLELSLLESSGTSMTDVAGDDADAGFGDMLLLLSDVGVFVALS